MHRSLRVRCDASALAGNYRQLRKLAGTATGAAIKANGYGLGAPQVVNRLWGEGCRDFFVSSWWEAAELCDLPDGALAVLHGLGPDDQLLPGVRPVLVSAAQVARWKQAERESVACDVMVDTGMNRLGLDPGELDILHGLTVHTLHSHLVSADEDRPSNSQQLAAFRAIREQVAASRYSLANSAGVFLGRDYAFDLVRPGLALYGGIPRPEAAGCIHPVITLESQVVQRRQVAAGSSVGYNATFTAPRELPVAILNIGYADGYWRAFSSRGLATFDGANLPIIGRVSMDLVALDVSAAPHLREGDWVTLDFDLHRWSAITGFSQYELLTGLGRRPERVWSEAA